MTTTYPAINGKREIPNPETVSSKYIDSDLCITVFYGGVIRGRSIQISLENDTIQLDNISAHILIKQLQEALSNDTKQKVHQ